MRHSSGIIGIGLAVLAAAAGCVGKRESMANSVPPENAIGPFVAAPRNILLAVGGTAQLSTSALTLTGAPLTAFDSVAYRLANVGDSVTVRVGTTGLVTGVLPTATSVPVNVVAFLNGTYNGDQILVTVTPTAVPGLTLSIQPPPGDSAKQAMGTAKTITPALRNPTTGASVTGVQLQYNVKPSDEDRLGVFTGRVQIRVVFNAGSVHQSKSPAAARNQIVPYVGEGSVWVYANVHAYGTLLQDSVLYSLSYPYTGSVAVSKRNLAVLTTVNGGVGVSASMVESTTLAPAATVTFANNTSSGDALTVTFMLDNPAAATAVSPPSTAGGASGNVTTLAAGQSSKRQFLTAGTYRWTMTTGGGQAPWSGQGTTGIILIK